MTATEIMTVAQAIRKMHPKLRRTTMAGIVHNGGSKRVYDCCGCGASISMSNGWPMTKRVRQFIADHDRDCGQKLIEEAQS